VIAGGMSRITPRSTRGLGATSRALTTFASSLTTIPEEARRLALQYADDFRLLEDLAWDRDDPRESIRLTMPPTDLRRVLMRLQAEAEGVLTACAEEEREEKEESPDLEDLKFNEPSKQRSRVLSRPARRRIFGIHQPCNADRQPPGFLSLTSTR
jgi:hypothetical protein